MPAHKTRQDDYPQGASSQQQAERLDKDIPRQFKLGQFPAPISPPVTQGQQQDAHAQGQDDEWRGKSLRQLGRKEQPGKQGQGQEQGQFRSVGFEEGEHGVHIIFVTQKNDIS